MLEIFTLIKTHADIIQTAGLVGCFLYSKFVPKKKADKLKKDIDFVCDVLRMKKILKPRDGEEKK